MEAGLRSFDLTMPEEINRRVTDLLSDLLFVTEPGGRRQPAAARASTPARIHFVGNPMIDTLLAHLDRFDPDAGARRACGLTGPLRGRDAPPPGERRRRPRRPPRLVAMLAAMQRRLPVVLPLHPRGRATLDAAGLGDRAAARASSSRSATSSSSRSSAAPRWW